MHLVDWFPTLPSYQAFNHRLNFLAPALQALAEALVCKMPVQASVKSHLLDSMPIVVAKGTRSNQAKVAPELCDKSYCSSQKMWYYGVKLHSLGQKRFEALPLPVCLQVSRASDNDLTVAKQLLPFFKNMDIFADKIYRSMPWQEELETHNNIRIHTPVKMKKEQKSLCSNDKLFSKAISRTRQAIEAFFAWIQDKTQIHLASKVRSLSGLIAFIFARLALVCFLLLGAF
jgi:transposase